MPVPSSSVSTSSFKPTANAVSDAESAGSMPAQSNLSVRIESFDIRSKQDWRGLIREVSALANSGGGQVRVNAAIAERDVLYHLERYTDSDFSDVQVRAGKHSLDSAATIDVGPAACPLGVVLAEDDHATADSTEQRIAPAFYFRQADRTVPGTTADMRTFIERLLRRTQRRWLRGIRRLLSRPVPAKQGVSKWPVRERIRLERAVLQPVRIVADPDAPALQPQDVEQLFPWRQKDLLHELNARLGGRWKLNSYYIQAVRRHHRLDKRPEFVFNLPGAGRRYSPAVADWIMEQFARNPDFFQQARVADQAVLRLRRRKPR